MIQKKSPTWTDVKAKLADFDRASLQGLVKDLYGASKDNQSFLHARFGLGADVLNPYKARIDRWLWPDLLKNQDVSASNAKKVVADYKKAIGRPEGLAELMVFYCERASNFSNAYRRDPVLDRLDHVRRISRNFGYGVGDEMDILLAEYKNDV